MRPIEGTAITLVSGAPHCRVSGTTYWRRQRNDEKEGIHGNQAEDGYAKVKQQPTDRMIQQQKRLQKELYDLKYPETKELIADNQAYNIHQQSDICSKQQFLPYKQQAKRAWVNEMKIAEWDENTPPQFGGTTKRTQECAHEFSKYYKMLAIWRKAHR
eukprot:2023768-Prymnesium_polylepis.1